jgi:short-chain fatty acids transporter
VVNFVFLIVAIILHGTPRRLLFALNEAVKGGAGIVIQFPFYAGIMAIMVNSGLAVSISNWLIGFASAQTLAFWTFSQRASSTSSCPRAAASGRCRPR